MPTYTWFNNDLDLHLRAVIGNGHSGGIDVRELGGGQVGEGHDDLLVQLGPSGANAGRTLIITASIRKGLTEPPPAALLTLTVYQTRPPTPIHPPGPPQNEESFSSQNPPAFDANGLCVVPLALTLV